jgi:hypothetical protein
MCEPYNNCKSNKILIKEYRKYFYIDKQLYENIQKLSPQLRNKLYIYSMRKFWRNFIPETAKIPIWYDHAKYQKILLFNAMQNNIHFLHLPCNTLEENKEYILGCQCNYCKNYGIHRIGKTNKLEYNYRKDLEDMYISNNNIIYELLPNSGSEWNDYNIIYDNYNYGLKIYDPGNDIYMTLKQKINGPLINFNY